MEYQRNKRRNSVQKVQTKIRIIMKLAVVTTFPPNRWTAYAKRMIESHVKFWPDDVLLHAYLSLIHI